MQCLAHEESSHDERVFCVSECDDVNAADPCGDKSGQQAKCISSDFISMSETFGYSSNDSLPTGFLGCSGSVCDDVCAGVNMTEPITIKTDSVTAVKTFCFPKRDSAMFMTEDLAELSAISRGCEGSHKMGDMYMHGSTHAACMDKFSEDGVKFDPDSSSSRHFVSVPLLVVATLAVTVGLM